MTTHAETDQATIEARAVRLLGRREHSRFELQRKLEQKGFAGEQVAAVLAQLAARGWQSDARFAESFARQRVQQGYGPMRIQAELQQRQLASELIQETLATLAVDWSALAAERLQRKFQGKSPATPKERARQQRFLLQRGFTPDQVRAAASQLAAGLPDAL